MTRTAPNPTLTTLLLAAGAALLLCTSGCSENPMPDDEARSVATSAAPGSEPADGAARTRAGLYATAAQAERLEAALKGRVVRIDSNDVAHLGVETVAGIVHGLVASGDLGHDAPVLVEGRNPRLSATLANRLSDDGLKRVWVVATP